LEWLDPAAPQRSQQARPTVAAILRQHSGEYVRQHARQAAPQVRNVLARLSLCRTRALGGHLYRCNSCAQEVNVYNSCGDRHCPQCSGGRRRDWLEGAASLLLPGVDYFQVVFTLPDKLSSLALGNRRPIYNLLFRSAWQALRELLTETFGIEAAATLVLHTWNQRLEHHAHVHALVPGGGPSLATGDWIKTRHPRHRRKKKPYLVDNELLGQRFRDKFIAACKRLHAKGELKLNGEWSQFKDSQAFDDFLDSLAPDGWVVFIEAPPTQDALPENVLKYLARYMTGGPISDRRLISYDGDVVRFWARSQDKPPTGTPPSMVREELPAVEFTRRWALHILPKGFVKVRHYGGFSNTKRQTYLERCRQSLGIAETQQSPHDQQQLSTDSPTETQVHSPACPRCRRAMRCIRSSARPSWRETFSSNYRPPWYHDD